MKNITKNRFLELSVVVPPLAEQHRIACAIQMWDEAVSVTEALINNSAAHYRTLLAKSLHCSLPSRLPAAQPTAFPPSVQPGIPMLSATPPGWRRVKLGDHLREVRRPLKLDANRPYVLVTVKRSRGGVVKREVLSGSEIKTPTQFTVRAGDFLISKRQIVHGACGLVPHDLEGAIVSNEYAVISSDGNVDLGFLRHLSESVYFQQTCFHSSIGVHVEKMIFNVARWLQWPIDIPSTSVQSRIAKTLDTALEKLVVLQKDLDALRRERSALMDQLLSGKRRLATLPMSDRVAEPVSVAV